jgi:hypothetical protein
MFSFSHADQGQAAADISATWVALARFWDCLRACRTSRDHEIVVAALSVAIIPIPYYFPLRASQYLDTVRTQLTLIEAYSAVLRLDGTT